MEQAVPSGSSSDMKGPEEKAVLFICLPQSLLVGASTPQLMLLLLTSGWSFFYLPLKICSSSGILQTSITSLGLLGHLALWVEQVTRFSALPPSSQTIGLPRQNQGSRANKSLLYSMLILLVLYGTLIQTSRHSLCFLC